MACPIAYADDSENSENKLIKNVNNAAAVENGVIIFKEAGENTEGVEVVNPFIGQDGTLGGAISFWINSPNTNSYGDDYGYDSILTITNKDRYELIKYDIQGTRQYSNTKGSKIAMNYWNAYLPLKAGEDAFITCVICYEGIKMYCNGKEIGQISYSGAADEQCRPLVKELLTYEDTRIFIGGTAEVDPAYAELCKQSVPANVKVWDLTAYKYSMTAEEAKQLYEEKL